MYKNISDNIYGEYKIFLTFSVEKGRQKSKIDKSKKSLNCCKN